MGGITDPRPFFLCWSFRKKKHGQNAKQMNCLGYAWISFVAFLFSNNCLSEKLSLPFKMVPGKKKHQSGGPEPIVINGVISPL